MRPTGRPRRWTGCRRVALGSEQGAVGAEAVLAMLVIVPVLLAVIAFAQMLGAWQAQNHVAAAAARQVAQEGGDSAALRARVAADLAAAGLAADDVRLTIQPATVDWREAVRMASSYPARALGVADRRGYLFPGYRADLVEFDQDMVLHRTWVAGVPTEFV